MGPLSPELEEERREDLRIRELRIEEATWTVWQERWNGARVSRWTHSCIPDVLKWRKCGFNFLDFYSTQILTGHGCFNAFRFRIGKSRTPSCWFGCDAPDTSEHTLLVCPRWDVLRKALYESLDIRTVRIYEVMTRVLVNRPRWMAFRLFCREVMYCKQRFERVLESDQLQDGDPLDGISLRALFELDYGSQQADPVNSDDEDS